ncbi:hypothetical protein V6248_02095 [Pseudoalteromonas agarivorans]|uniref:hypothetical protein n=1 Tax=Pseudoalteromonas agarivorans TaxID=176102 RepID=UPI00311DEF75
MKIYNKGDNIYVGALQCGGGLDAYLQIELSDIEVKRTQFVKLKAMNVGLGDAVSVDKIKKSVELALQLFFNKTGKIYYIKTVSYIPNDSTHYHLHTRIVYQILNCIYTNSKFN